MLNDGLAWRTEAARRVFRVGYSPNPWEWTDWQYATAGRFTGRWDDPSGRWRTLYVGGTLLGCYLELLARFRPDPVLDQDLLRIDEDVEYPSAAAGAVPRSWVEPRMAGQARLSGHFAVLTTTESVATIRMRFLALAATLGLADIDAALLRNAEPREFTNQVSSWVHDLEGPDRCGYDGISFESRHGDDQSLWAIYERPQDGSISTTLELLPRYADLINTDDADLNEAMRVHRLHWAS